MSKLSNSLEDSGLFEKIDHSCGTTKTIFSNKEKTAKVNEGLDWYFRIALGLGADWQFDDNNQTTPPIQSINLEDGQSRYELDDFTSEILNICRVEIIDNSDEHHVIYPVTLSEIEEAYDDYYEDDSTPATYNKIGKFIDIHPAPNYSKTNGLTIYFDRPASRFAFVSFTANATTDVINSTAHGLSNGDTVILETDGTIPTGWTADTVNYYVVGKATDTFQIALTAGGSAVLITDAQTTSNHTYLVTSKSPGIPSIHHPFIADYASFLYCIDKQLPRKNDLFTMVKDHEQSIKSHFGRRNKDTRNIMTTYQRSFR